MFNFFLGIIIVVIAVVLLFISKVFVNKEIYPLLKKIRIWAFVAVVSIGALIICSSIYVNLKPAEMGMAYGLTGVETELHEGYNPVAPWSKVYRWDTSMKMITFSQGEAVDDIYGAMTNEKDYIQVVATIGVHIEPSKFKEYVALYGTDQIDSAKVRLLLKTVSRSAIERAIGSHTTAEVMSDVKKISAEAKEYLDASTEKLVISVDSFTIDDYVAPDNYENAIREQAQLRMDREKAILQREINAQQAEADRIKAEGEATVAKTKAEADATVKRIAAENAAQVAKIAADNEAQVKAVQAEADANVRKIAAEAKATETTTQAQAEAEATIKKGDAEASAISAQGEAYKKNPELIELRIAEINATVQSDWAKKWSGFSFEGMSGFNFANMTDILKGLIPNLSSTGVNTPVVTE